MERASGVLMHISSLYGDYSCGSLGKSAFEFVDFLKSCGFSYWQVLPTGLCDECNSPYKSLSAFAGTPFFIDLEILEKKGLLTKAELENTRQQNPYVCEFDRLKNERLSILFKAAKRAKNKDEINGFIDENKELSDFCEFAALKQANAGRFWKEWTVKTPKAEDVFAWRFIQYEFFTQWQKLKDYADKNGIKLIGDMPLYVDLDSSDVYFNPSLFMLDKNGDPTDVAGVPPDYFSADGQLWGNPLYDYGKMEQDGFSWWKRRIAHNLKMFDGLRIDHFRGIESFFAVKNGETTAKNGRWIKGPGEKLVDAIKQTAGDKLIIAEDLGDITKEVEALLKYSGLPGMRVFQFSFLGGDNPHLPHNYIKNCVAYSGTHDNNTLLGYLWELDEQTRQRMLCYCGFKGNDWGSGCDDIIRTLFASSAGLVILPIQDVLGYGSDTRMNRPGTAKGNWLYRVTKEQLCGIDKEKYLKLNRTYFR